MSGKMIVMVGLAGIFVVGSCGADLTAFGQYLGEAGGPDANVLPEGQLAPYPACVDGQPAWVGQPSIRPDHPPPIYCDFTELDGAAGVAIHEISGRTYAVVTASIDDGVQIIDITRPYSPMPVAAVTDNVDGFTELDGAAGVAVHDISNRTYAVVTAAFDNPWQVIDITRPDSPLPVALSDYTGDFAGLAWGMDLVILDISGGTYAVGSDHKSDSVWIYNITHPDNSFLASTITDGADGFTELDGATGVAVHEIADKTYAVVAASMDDGVQIIDITDPASPLPVAAVADAANGFTNLTIPRDIAIHDISGRTYAVVAAAYGVQIMDITRLGNPLPVASLSDDTDGFTELAWPSGVAIHDISNRTYAVVAASIDFGVQIMDITDPASPLPVAAVTGNTDGFTDLDDATGVAIHDISNRTYAVVTARYGMQIIDITQPDDPLPVAAVTGNTDNFVASGVVHGIPDGFAALGWVYGITIHDISGRTYAMMTDYQGMQIMDITDPTSPLLVAWLDSARGIAMHDISNRTYAVVTGSYGVRIIDITQPDDPLPVATHAVGYSGLLPPTISASNVQLPVTSTANNASGYVGPAWVSGIAIHDISNRTYAVVTVDSGMQVIDITQPDDPLPVAAITDGMGGFTELAGADAITTYDISNRTYAVVAGSYDYGVQIIDITQPYGPMPVAAVTDVRDAGRYNEWYTILTHNPPCTALFLDSLGVGRSGILPPYSADEITNGVQMSMVMRASEEDNIIHLVAERPEVSTVVLVTLSPLEVIPNPPPTWRTLGINPDVQIPRHGVPNACYDGLDPALDRLVMENVDKHDRGGLVEVLVHTHHNAEVQAYLEYNGAVIYTDIEGGDGSTGAVAANVPISLLGPLSERDDVLMVEAMPVTARNE